MGAAWRAARVAAWGAVRAAAGAGVRTGVLVCGVAIGCAPHARSHDDEAHATPRQPAGPDAMAGAAIADAAAGAMIADAAVASDATGVDTVAAGATIADAAVASSATGVDAAVASAADPPIVQAPIRWTAERARLTLAYRRQHSDPTAADLTIAPHVIVLHYTAGGSAKATRGYFDNERIEASRKDLARAGAVNVSAHFLVDRDGTIYQLQPADRFARHCIGMNHIAIGIENVGDEARFPLTDAQVAADATLVRMLARQFPITHLLGHFEVMRFRNHPYFVERDAYQNDKPDPGPRFMARVRARVADLGLAGL
ncbi:MAG TPA: peptidoglycan recognition family protein [Kofleriaceae bacterium]|nr:peptidoglycan recognition family protein [Kofleriaceae bacterium]